MTLTLAVTLLALACLCPLAAFEHSSQQSAEKPNTQAQDSTPSAAQVLERYVKAIGGEAAIRKITSRVLKGTFELPAFGATGSAEIYATAPNKLLTVFTIPGFGILRQGFDGTRGWAQDPQLGLRDQTGAELANMRRTADFYKDIRLGELYPKITLRGKDKVDGGEVYVLEATPADGSPVVLYFSIETGLLVRIDSTREAPMGRVPAVEHLQDYKEVDGIRIPFTSLQSLPNMSFVIKINEVKCNVAIDEARFEKPKAH